ncbi:hypothetical protein EKK58_02955 [Candidatus Dependentiae bacterium]|nr:MAG: hypothetical protein EKK58_02955 [Candidatus Dependentiae bacterium]
MIIAEQIEISAKKDSTKTPLLIHYIKSKKIPENNRILDIIKNDLIFIEQFDLTVIQKLKLPRKQERIELSKQYPFGIFMLDKPTKIDVYIIDLSTNKTLVGKRIFKHENERRLGHTIADLIIESLTGSPGFFSTYIAYTKEVLTPKNPYIATKQLCIAEYDGSHETVLVEKPGLIFGLRWDPAIPRIFYSQHTKTNIQLRMVNLSKKIHTVADNDGITMLPTFMPNQGIIVAATNNNKFSQLYEYTLQGITQLTFFEGNSTAPSFSAGDTMLYFCSDFKNNSPHIFGWNMKNGIENVIELTPEGYCTCPVINSTGNVLVYTKLVKGYMQIFLYDIQTKMHRQMTFDQTNKESCSWSPCNTYLLYCATKHDSQIIQLNIITGTKKTITPTKYRCSYPAWSPVYKDFLLVLS